METPKFDVTPTRNKKEKSPGPKSTSTANDFVQPIDLTSKEGVQTKASKKKNNPKANKNNESSKNTDTSRRSGSSPKSDLCSGQGRRGSGGEAPRKIFGDHALFIMGNAHCPLKHDFHFIHSFHSFITELRIIRIKGITKLLTYTYFKSSKYELHLVFSKSKLSHISNTTGA